MASRSKKRRRVLGASCILAALIIAGSSFAWFTSKDEVTNRLTANADYGVSIVESFAPPVNWLPGQEVNKDVYAINTGSIAAFVREDVSGVLTITVDKETAELTDDSVQLTDEERYIMEAGSYLAYKPATSAAKLGDLIVVRPDDQGYPAMTDFMPDVEGLYVFRRTITVAEDNADEETFTYDGYYFVPGAAAKFYKISNLRTYADADEDFADDGVRTDGQLSVASAGFYEEVQEVVDPIDLAYDATENALIATYELGNNKATADYVALAAAVDQASHELDLAWEAYGAAVVEEGAASGGENQKQNALVIAKEELDAALANYQEKFEAYTNYKISAQDAAAAYAAAQAATAASKAKLWGTGSALTSADGDSLGAKLNAATTALTEAQDPANGGEEDLDALESEIGRWNEAKNLNNMTLADYEAFIVWLNQHPDDELHDYFVAFANKKVAQINYDTELANYNALVSAESSAQAAAAGTAASASNARAVLQSAFNRLTNAQNAYQTALEEYNEAVAATADAAEITEKWGKLFDAANAAYTAAKDAFDAVTDNDLKASDGTIKIVIKLSDDVTTTNDATPDKWLLYKNPLVANKAVFFYTGILESGETSSKLIDSVILDSSVTQDMFKSFDFDINVALASAQITYDADGNILTDAALDLVPNDLVGQDIGTDNIGAKPVLTDATDINTGINWT